MRKQLIYIGLKDTSKGYKNLTQGKVYEVYGNYDKTITVLNDLGMYRSYSLYNYYGVNLFIDLIQYRNNVIEDILT